LLVISRGQDLLTSKFEISVWNLFHWLWGSLGNIFKNMKKICTNWPKMFLRNHQSLLKRIQVDISTIDIRALVPNCTSAILHFPLFAPYFEMFPLFAPHFFAPIYILHFYINNSYKLNIISI